MKAAECNCRGCPSKRQTCVTRPVEQAEIAVVLEYPTVEAGTKDDFLHGRPGSSAALLKKTFEMVGLDLEKDVYLTSALNCHPNTKKEAMLKNAMKSCRPRLVEELKEAGVKKVLCLGTIGYSALMSADKNLPITKFRGRWTKAFGMDIMATFSPAFCLASPDWYRDYAFDLEKFVSMDGHPGHPEVDYWIPETLTEVEEAFKWLKSASFVSCDLETTGLSPVSDTVIACGLGVLDKNDNGTTVILDNGVLSKKKTWRLLSTLLSRRDQATVFHNAKFDLQFLKQEFGRRGLRYKPQEVHDTMLLHYTTDERPMGKFRSHVLERLAETHFDAPKYGIDMKKFLKEWAEADEYDRRRLRKGLHTYLALDCYYTARLFPLLWNMALKEDEELLDLYETLLMPGTLALAEIELHGVLVDRTFYEKAEKDLLRRAEKIRKRLCKVVGDPEFNPGSPKQVSEFVYGEDGLNLPFGEAALKRFKNAKEPRRSGSGAGGQRGDKKVYHTARRGKQQEGPTAKAVLKTLAREFPEKADVLNDIVQYRNLTKNAGTYVTGMLKRIDADGRVHGNFNLHGTATGRLSSDNPNLQNIPDASHTKVEVRNGFVAPVGSVLIEADYSQLELRIAAWLSEDDGFKQVYIDDRDVHQEVTWALFHKTREEASKYERYMAKCCNFGVMYGRGAASLAEGPEMDYILDSGGTPWSVSEVEEFFDRMLKNWPRYNKWMDEQRDFAYANNYVQSPTGRKRRFPLIPPSDGGSVGRQAINTPIQGTASDFTLHALINIHNRLPEGAYIVSTVHDSILIECKKALVKEVLTIVKEEMEHNLPFDVDVPFKSDAEVAARWGEMEKFTWDEDTLSLVPVELETAG